MPRCSSSLPTDQNGTCSKITIRYELPSAGFQHASTSKCCSSPWAKMRQKSRSVKLECVSCHTKATRKSWLVTIKLPTYTFTQLRLTRFQTQYWRLSVAVHRWWPHQWEEFPSRSRRSEEHTSELQSH